MKIFFDYLIFLVVVLNLALISAQNSVWAGSPDDSNKITVANCYYNDGIKNYNSKNYSKAIESFKLAIGSDSTNYNAKYYLAITYQQIKDYSDAIKIYTELTKFYSDKTCGKLAKQALDDLAKVSLLRLDNNSMPDNNSKTNVISKSNVISNSSNRSNLADDSTYIKAALKSNFKATFNDTLPNEAKIEFSKVKSQLEVEGMLNNHTVYFWFDTGAGYCCLSRTQLEKLGIEPPQGPPVSHIRSSSKTKIEVPLWILRCTLKVSNIERHDFPLVVLDSPNFPRPLIGLNFWDGYRASVDNAANSIRLTKKTVKSTLGYCIPFTKVRDKMIVEAIVNGKKIPVIFDTGCSDVTFSIDQARQCGIEFDQNTPISSCRIYSGFTKTYQVKVSSIKLGPIDLYDVPARVRIQDSLLFPLLGQGVFGQGYEYVIDDQNKIIRFIKR